MVRSRRDRDRPSESAVSVRIADARIVGGVLLLRAAIIALLAVISVLVVVSGWGMGGVIRWHLPGARRAFRDRMRTLVDRVPPCVAIPLAINLFRTTLSLPRHPR